MSWLTLIAGVISAIVAALGYLERRQAIDSATAIAVSNQLQGALDAIRSAQETKAEVDSRTSGPDASNKLRNDPANLYRD